MTVLIVGAGGHAQVVADAFQASRRLGAPVDVVGFLDDAPETHGRCLLGVTVLGPVSHRCAAAFDALIVAIGNNGLRARLTDGLEQEGRRFAVAAHPSSVVAQDVSIGTGSMLCAGAIVNTGSHVGRHVILNTGCRVDHHARIGDCAHVAPGATLGGHVTVGARALVGLGAAVLPGVSIGADAVVGAGAVVTRDVPAGVRVVGVPARPL